jgi:hypothetical protein
MLVVDLLHEFELGVWRSLFVHLIRILNAFDPRLVHELDYRSVPMEKHPHNNVADDQTPPQLPACSHL